MEPIRKYAQLRKADADEGELSLINAQSLRPLTAEEVFTFRLAACNDQVDRDFERFPEQTLEDFARLFTGRPVLMDHQWSAGSQTARVYAAAVEDMPGVPGGKQLVLRCYMPRLRGNADTIAAIEAGLLRECSVGVAVKRAVCSVCGKDNRLRVCEHRGGQIYQGQACHFDLEGAADVYEVSLVAVPAQPDAGIIKSKRYGGAEPTPPAGPELWQDQALLELEKNRF